MAAENKLIMKNRIKEERLSAWIREIAWDNILLHLDARVVRKNFPADRDLQFYMVADDHRAGAELVAARGEGDVWHLTLNVTNPGTCRCLPDGRYSIAVCDGEDILCEAAVSPELVQELEDRSRIFRHGGETAAYCVMITARQSGSVLLPEFRVTDATNEELKALYPDRLPDESAAPKKGSPLRSALVKTVKKAARAGYAFYRKRYKNKNKNKKTVLFMSEQNEEIKFNLAAVYDRMLARGLDKEFEMLQSFHTYAPGKARYNPGSWFNMLKKLGKADYIFLDDHCPLLDWVELDKTQIPVQLWHAGAGYKAVGYSRWGHTGGAQPMNGHRQYRYAVSPSREFSHFFAEQFGINESQILPTGLPRMDAYLDPERRRARTAELYERFPILRDKKVILFAPTYRGTKRANAHYPYDRIDFRRLYDFCGETHIVLFKMHPWVPDPVPIEEQYKDRFLDMGTYPDINDLFYLTDVLISDYSSAISEYSLMHKPALFYAFDERQMISERGFHRDYRSSTPGKVCRTFDELIAALEAGDYEFDKMEDYVRHHFDMLDTHASDRVIDWILLGQMPEEFSERLRADEEKMKRLQALDFRSLSER